MIDINNELPTKCEWLKANRLSLNLDKTISILFSNRHDAVNDFQEIFLNDVAIDFQLRGEFLGLSIDSNLKFVDHIQVISKKIS